jgi:DNA-directed RNA polymerase specialized sigma24 family protein
VNINDVLTAVRPRLVRAAYRLPSLMQEDAVQEACIVIWNDEERVLAAEFPVAMATALGLTAVRRFDGSRSTTGAPSRSPGSGRTAQASHPAVSSDLLRELGIEAATTDLVVLAVVLLWPGKRKHHKKGDHK